MRTEDVIAHEFTLFPGMTVTLFSIPATREFHRNTPVYVQAPATAVAADATYAEGMESARESCGAGSADRA